MQSAFATYLAALVLIRCKQAKPGFLWSGIEFVVGDQLMTQYCKWCKLSTCMTVQQSLIAPGSSESVWTMP